MDGNGLLARGSWPSLLSVEEKDLMRFLPKADFGQLRESGLSFQDKQWLNDLPDDEFWRAIWSAQEQLVQSKMYPKPITRERRRQLKRLAQYLRPPYLFNRGYYFRGNSGISYGCTLIDQRSKRVRPEKPPLDQVHRKGWRPYHAAFEWRSFCDARSRLRGYRSTEHIRARLQRVIPLLQRAYDGPSPAEPRRVAEPGCFGWLPPPFHRVY